MIGVLLFFGAYIGTMLLALKFAGLVWRLADV